MELNVFTEKIIEVLKSNNINYQYENVGHIQAISPNQGILYLTKDIIIKLCNNNCIVTISFFNDNHEYVIREMTIQVSNKSYGFKHCKMYRDELNKITVFEPLTKLTENNLKNIIDYINILIKYQNDINTLTNIWHKSLTRTTYKKMYNGFSTTHAKIISKYELLLLKERFNLIDNKFERIFIFNDDEIIELY